MSKFSEYAPEIMRLLMGDFKISVEDAAAIVGNLAHECGGFEKLQEVKPTVAGSRGGYGWAQWTGPRRKAYEAFCRKNNRNPASFDANYAYLFRELSDVEPGFPYSIAIRRTKQADGLYNKVVAFENAYEKSSAKHYESRHTWAKKALALGPSKAKPGPVKPPSSVSESIPPKPSVTPPPPDVSRETFPENNSPGAKLLRWLASLITGR